LGYSSGSAITTGSQNVIIGSNTGNADGLDIRTATNYVVVSDGDGNRQITMKEGQTLALDSAVPNSGTGITFPATQSASTNANTLDDYEEGNWTPAIGGTATYSVQSGQYVKIGNMVYFVFQLNILVKGTGNNYTITGFPFGASVNIRGNIQYFETIATSIVSMAGFIGSGSTQVDIYSATAASTNPSNNTIFQNGAVLYGTGFYQN